MAEETGETAKEKKRALDRLLDGEYALLHINTACQGLSIPSYLCSNPVVTLKISRWFRGSMSLNETQVEAELLFNNSYFKCIIPFEAVWGVTGAKGENLIWPSSVPPGLLNTIHEVKEKEELKDSKVETAEPSEKPAEEKSAEKKEKKKPHLVRVK